MPPLEFRRAVPGDIGALVDLRIEFLRLVKDGGIPDEPALRADLAGLFARQLASGTTLAWLCLEGGRAVGACCLGLLRRGGGVPREGEILNLHVVADRRRRGIGAALLGLALREAEALGLRRVRLRTSEGARRLYERSGFRGAGPDMALELG